MANQIDIIKGYNLELITEILGFWKHIHQNPELSFAENDTSAFIADKLRNNGIKVFENEGKAGVVGLIEGGLPGQTIGVRAELDALPINEATSLDFKSNKEGVMHACGHDIHMASLLGTALILNRMKSQLCGRVLLIFEPGEEQLPGGALEVINSDVFKNFQPRAMVAFHVLPELNAGKVGFCEGQYMASGDEIYLTVKGKGGHAALPQTTVNPIIIASKIVLDLKAFNDDESPRGTPSILSFGKVIANGATNVIPNEVQIEGTFRTMDEQWRYKAHSRIEEIASNVAKSMGGGCDVEIRKGYPSVYNDPELTNLAKKLAYQYLGEGNVVELHKRMTTDDFAYFSQILPSVFFRMGVGFDDRPIYSLHNPSFVANGEVLKNSSGLMAWLIININSALRH